MKEHSHTPQCRQLMVSLSDYVDGELQAELCAEIEEHLKNCDDCRIVVDTLRKTVELYRQSPDQVDLPDPVRERLFARLELNDFMKKG
jgi:predicted anti-sigma-YlaC factor YlaD